MRDAAIAEVSNPPVVRESGVKIRGNRNTINKYTIYINLSSPNYNHHLSVCPPHHPHVLLFFLLLFGRS